MKYNPTAGIREYLGSLEGLHRLIADRREAWYVRREPLTDFIVLSNWLADSCGNFMRITEPRGLDAGLSVISRADLYDLIPGLRLVSTMGGSPPPARVVCAGCDTGWTINDCHYSIVKNESKSFPLDEFVGKTLLEVSAIFDRRTDAEYMLSPEPTIRHDRFKDTTPDPKYPSIQVNPTGWVGKREGITEAYVVQEGDSGYFNVWKYLHPMCNAAHLERQYRTHYQEILTAAGIEGPIKTVPNGYCPCEDCGPWVEVTTKWGVIEMGWRKRVINIDWTAIGANLDHLFEKETVTRGAAYIHAWGKAPAVDYLTRIRQELSKADPG